MNNKHEKLIICGPSGSGKDFLRRKMIDLGLLYLPKFTTRPKRSGEINGIDYEFITPDDYHKLLHKDDIKVYQKFNINGEDWYYGITRKCFEESQVFIMTPGEIKMLSEDDKKTCFIVHLNIDMEVRIERLRVRSDMNDSISRRISSDELDFKNFSEYDVSLTDPLFDPEWIYSIMN